MSLIAKPEAEAERAKQVGSLLDAIYEAQQLAITVSSSGVNSSEVKQLFWRLEAVRLEIEQLHFGAGPVLFHEIDPKWTGLVPWRRAPEC